MFAPSPLFSHQNKLGRFLSSPWLAYPLIAGQLLALRFVYYAEPAVDLPWIGVAALLVLCSVAAIISMAYISASTYALVNPEKPLKGLETWSARIFRREGCVAVLGLAMVIGAAHWSSNSRFDADDFKQCVSTLHHRMGFQHLAQALKASPAATRHDLLLMCAAARDVEKSYELLRPTSVSDLMQRYGR